MSYFVVASRRFIGYNERTVVCIEKSQNNQKQGDVKLRETTLSLIFRVYDHVHLILISCLMVLVLKQIRNRDS